MPGYRSYSSRLGKTDAFLPQEHAQELPAGGKPDEASMEVLEHLSMFYYSSLCGVYSNWVLATRENLSQ